MTILGDCTHAAPSFLILLEIQYDTELYIKRTSSMWLFQPEPDGEHTFLASLFRDKSRAAGIATNVSSYVFGGDGYILAGVV